MHSHRLIVEKGAPEDEWLLEWNDTTFVLKDPDGRPVLEAAAAHAHRAIEIYELYAEGKVSFQTPAGSLTFKPQSAAVADLRAFVEDGLRSDTEYRVTLKQQAARVIPRGILMFLVAGSLFGLYCWWASWAPDPPPGHWLRWIGWLIHLMLLVLLGTALAGPFVAYFGLRQLLRIRRIERIAAKAASRTSA